MCGVSSSYHRNWGKLRHAREETKNIKRKRFWLLLWDKVLYKPQALLLKHQRDININSINILTPALRNQWESGSKTPGRASSHRDWHTPPFLVSGPGVHSSLWTKEQSQACHTTLLMPPLLAQKRDSCVSALPWHLHRLPSRNRHRCLQVSPTAVASAPLLCLPSTGDTLSLWARGNGLTAAGTLVHRAKLKFLFRSSIL